MFKKLRLISGILSCGLLACLQQAYALPTCLNTVPAGTVIGATWTLAGSPYCVEGNIRAIALTIEAGVEVYVTGPYEIEAASAFTVNGTKDNPVLFSAFDPADTVNLWTGIKFLNTPSIPVSSLTHVIIEHSSNSALRIGNSFPVINSCTLRNNSTSGFGGGLQVELTGGELILDGCTISDNISASHGGGVYALLDDGAALTFRNTIVSNNTANPTQAAGNYKAGGLYVVNGNGTTTGSYELNLDNTVVVENVVHSECYSWNCTDRAWGGGIFATGGNLTAINSTLNSNQTLARDSQIGGGEHNFNYGGAIYFDSATGLLSVSNSVLSCNSSFLGGSTPLGQGSGIYVAAGTMDIINSTLGRNITEALWVNSGDATILNAILYDDASIDKIQIAGAGIVTASYSDIQTGDSSIYPGVSNINVNPVFKGSGCNAPDFALIELVSLPIDAGNPDTSFDDACFPPSLATVANDMGAYGGPGACNFTDADGDGAFNDDDNCILRANGPLIPDAGGNIQRDTDGDNYGNYCDPDLDNNGVVQAADLAIFKPLFFSSDPDADFDGDGVVNAGDLSILKAMFFGAPGPSGLAP